MLFPYTLVSIFVSTFVCDLVYPCGLKAIVL